MKWLFCFSFWLCHCRIPQPVHGFCNQATFPHKRNLFRFLSSPSSSQKTADDDADDADDERITNEGKERDSNLDATGNAKPTLLEEWQERRDRMQKNVELLVDASMTKVAQRELEIRDKLRESIEEMRQDLINNVACDQETRRIMNQHLIEARSQIKQDLRRLRDGQVDKLDERRKEITETVNQLDQELTPFFVYDAGHTWNDLITTVETSLPHMKATFAVMEQMSSRQQQTDPKKGILHEEVQRAMDQFQADMEDRLTDLRDDTNFQLRIGQGK